MDSPCGLHRAPICSGSRGTVVHFVSRAHFNNKTFGCSPVVVSQAGEPDTVPHSLSPAFTRQPCSCIRAYEIVLLISKKTNSIAADKTDFFISSLYWQGKKKSFLIHEEDYDCDCYLSLLPANIFQMA